MSEQVHRRKPEPLISLTAPLRVHVVGIGGPGMSPLALLLHGLGHHVTGSDLRDSHVVQQLRDAGIVVTIGHDASLIHNVDVVVYSTAIPSSNVEIQAAHTQSIPVRHRSNLLASLAASHDSIGVAGTHGKTTTTALLTSMLQQGGMSPSSIIGAELHDQGVGAHVGQGNVFVVEADESDGTLEMLPLTSIVVTNIDVDHLDYFGTFEEMRSAFTEVTQRAERFIVINADDVYSDQLRTRLNSDSRVISFGRHEDAHVRIIECTPTESGIHLVLASHSESHHIHLPIRGDHNAYNCAAAFAMATAYGVSAADACAAAEHFVGVERRFTERGTWNGALLVDDYAHLPAEINAALSAARSHPLRTGKVVAVFQPNRFHRIAAMADAYENAFAQADHVVITDVYASGTTPIDGVTGELVVNAVKKAHSEVVWAPTRADIVTNVSSILQPGDVCVSMGCGDIESFPDDLVQANS